jgi:hypothetical protein
MPNPWVIIGAIVVFLLAVTGSYFKGKSDSDAAWTIKISEQERVAREKEQELQKEHNNVANQLRAENERIVSRLDDALEQLRSRPSRLPEPARTACTGSSGAELSREDAGFLAREAARADKLRAELDACYKREDANYAAMNR